MIPSPSARVEDSKCSSPCAAESSRMCGGVAAYSVYRELPRRQGDADPIMEIPDDMVLEAPAD